MRPGATLVAVLCALPVAAAEWSLTELFSARSSVVETHASFAQERYSLLLEQPLRSNGHLYYHAPDFLSQEIDTPYALRKTLDGDTLSILRDGRQENLSLRRYPRAGLYARALRGVLSGRLDDIEEHFEVRLSGDEHDWILRLTSRADLRESDSRSGHPGSPRPYIEIRGQRERLHHIVLRESATERTVMEIRESP